MLWDKGYDLYICINFFFPYRIHFYDYFRIISMKFYANSPFRLLLTTSCIKCKVLLEFRKYLTSSEYENYSLKQHAYYASLYKITMQLKATKLFIVPSKTTRLASKRANSLFSFKHENWWYCLFQMNLLSIFFVKNMYAIML